jgi:hypothetical protein
LFITPDGLAALPASSQVTTHSTITGITSNRKMGRRFVEKIAWKKAAAQKGQAEAIASAHAQVRINTRVDQQTEDLLTQSNEQYTDKFWGPLNERGLFPEQLQLSSSGQSMKIVALGAAPLQLAALGEPPRIATPDADLGATVHESMINNMLQIALGGMIVREENVQEIATRLLGHLPEQLKPDKEQEPWAVTFAEQQPISVAFGNNEVRVTVRGHRFARGDNNYPGMNVTARYQLVGTGQQVKAVRQGGLEIFPPDFVPGSGQRLSGRQVAIRKLLQRRFGKIFPEEMVPQGFVPKGNLAKAGKLTPVEIASRDGWLLVALKAVASPPAVTQASDAPPRVAVSGQQ